MTVGLKILSVSGALTVQDAGRSGYQRYGVAEGGAMDGFALAEGAVLLDNRPDLATLEMAAAGGTFVALGGSLQLACSGAEMPLSVNGQPRAWRSSFELCPGEQLRIGAATTGVYGYLHVRGGWRVESVLGSASTHTRAAFGGHCGRVLRDADILTAHPVAFNAGQAVQLPVPDYFCRPLIRILWGAQAHWFDVQMRQRFLDATFTLSSRRDRMGARLESDAGLFSASSSLSGISDAVLAGDVQITGDGIATVLLADRQPTGGYPRIATIISADMDAVAQLRSGSEFRFELVSMQRAVAALRDRVETIEQLPRKLCPLVRDPASIPDLLSYNLIDGVVAAASDDDLTL